MPKPSSQFNTPINSNDHILTEQETNPELTEITESRDSITVSRKLHERRSTVDVGKITETKENNQEVTENNDSDTEDTKNIGRSLSADNDDKLADEEVENLTTRFRKSIELDSDQLVSVLTYFIFLFHEWVMRDKSTCNVQAKKKKRAEEVKKRCSQNSCKILAKY